MSNCRGYPWAGGRVHAVLVFIILIAFCAKSINSLADDNVDDFKIVKTNYGLIKGRKLTTIYEANEYYAYRGIPYAQPPLNELRFKPPVELAERWGDNVLDATEFRNVCMQMRYDGTAPTGSEDCLHLNVYVPSKGQDDETGKFAVMAFIHGGGFFEGSGNDFFFGPDLLINKNVILVTFNYRLGPFGFFSLGTNEYSGNMGLKDQVMALQWIADNIEHFNGDKNKVTLFGHSAGAASTHFHTMAPASQGLFQRAIVMSGSVLNNWAYTSNVGHRALMAEYAHQHDKIFPNAADLMEFLQTADAGDLVEKTHFFIFDLVSKEILLKWLPVIEDATVPGAFITERPEITLQRDVGATQIDTMFGATDAEFLLFIPTELNNPRYIQEFYDEFHLQLPNKRNPSPEDYETEGYKKMAAEVKAHYFKRGLKLDDEEDRDSFYKYSDLLSDVFFAYGIDKSVKLQTQYSNGSTYYYRFSGVNQLNWFRTIANLTAVEGAVHGEELCVLFKCQGTAEMYEAASPDSPERKIIENITTLWSNFAKFGNPTPNDQPIKWRKATKKIVSFMEIGQRLISALYPNAPANLFWDNLYKKFDEDNNEININSNKGSKNAKVEL